ncbi:Uncharacterised protein [Burkholderia pseudomallei]|nr:Uncharacterised protein [Burkholderia pseudomallei]
MERPGEIHRLGEQRAPVRACLLEHERAQRHAFDAFAAKLHLAGEPARLRERIERLRPAARGDGRRRVRARLRKRGRAAPQRPPARRLAPHDVVDPLHERLAGLRAVVDRVHARLLGEARDA